MRRVYGFSIQAAAIAARVAWLVAFLCGFAGLGSTAPWQLPAAAAQEAQWIWSPVEDVKDQPAGTAYFRRDFMMTQPEAGEVQITADEAYELYVNGHKAGEGTNWRVLNKHDITKYLAAGRNAASDELVSGGGRGFRAHQRRPCCYLRIVSQ